MSQNKALTALRQKALSVARKLKADFWVDGCSRQFIEFAHKRWPKRAPLKNQPVILIELYDDSQYPWLWGHYANELAGLTGGEIRTFYFAKTLWGKLGLGKKRQKKVYASIGAQPGLRLKVSPLANFRAMRETKKILAGLKKKEDLFDVEYRGYRIGKLLTQSFLRGFYETIKLDHPYMKRSVYDAVSMIDLCEEYFTKNKVVAVFMTHTIFTYYGVLCRVAARHGAKVFRGAQRFLDGKLQSSILCVDDQYFYQEFPRPWEYHQLFSALPAEEQIRGLKWGQDMLEKWLGGRAVEVGGKFPGRSTPTWMMPVHGQRELKGNGKPNIVIMMNCFFDGPHFFRHSLFIDFFEWLKFTLTTARETDFNWYIKSHPNAVPQNDDAIAKVVALFPEVQVIDGKKVSNKQLLAEGVNAIFSIHGSVLHEFAYYGIPTVAAGDHAHTNYHFYHEPKNLEEYRKLILNADRLESVVDKDELAEFFYMHYQFIMDHDRNNPFMTAPGLKEFIQRCPGNMGDPAVLKFHVDHAHLVDEEAIHRFLEKFYRKHMPTERLLPPAAPSTTPRPRSHNADNAQPSANR